MLLTKITVYCHLQRKNKKLSTAFANACTSARLRQTVGYKLCATQWLPIVTESNYTFKFSFAFVATK
jgi:hypothetical protein